MRFLLILVAAFALIATALPIQTSAQNPAGELVRKARAGEKDSGFCAAATLEKVTFEEAQVKAGRRLSESDVVERMSWAITRGGELMCFHFVFGVPAQRDGQKCRPTETYACQAGGDCRVLKSSFICEMSAGKWD